jgi:hypothetical protein
VHGQFYDFLQCFKLRGKAPATAYLFPGDYVDRGKQRVETIAYLFALKCALPTHVHLLRGNHEALKQRRSRFLGEH